MLPPTSQLPSIKSICTYPLESLDNAVQYLRLVYNPEVRGSRRRKTLPSAKEHQDPSHSASEIDSFRTDAFERAYSMRWLTALISHYGPEESDQPEETSTLNLQWDALIENAASLLAICAGTASAGVIKRHFVFDLVDSSTPITIDLTDVPLDNQDYGSVGAQTWGGACVLADMITEAPDAFGLPRFQQDISAFTLRCLELGAGTGLVSLVVTKTAEQLILQDKLHVAIDIVATDYYPSVLSNLERNIQFNLGSSKTPTDSRVCLVTDHLDWSAFPTSQSPQPIFEEGFDVVYGADIIYEAQHAAWIKACLVKLLRKTINCGREPAFHLIIPLRATHAVESSTIEHIFPKCRGNNNGDQELVVKYKEVIICDAESGKDGEEIEYAYYKIGWGWS